MTARILAALMLAVVAGALLLVPPPAKAQFINTLYVSFHLGEYEVSEGGTVTVGVTLEAPSDRSVTIPITATNQGGASNADYSGVPASVTFATGEDAQTFIFTAVTDTVTDPGEIVLLGFGTLPAGVAPGDFPTSPVRIISPLLVSNTGQEIEVGSEYRLDNTARIRAAQGFTTGTEDDGYTLISLGMHFDYLDAATAGANLQITLNAESGGNPGNALCTLSEPTTFPYSGAVTFGFPSTCPGLAKETSYFVVAEHLNAVDPGYTADYWLNSTDASAEDTGSATGWSIADEGRTSSSSSGTWSTYSGLSFQIKLRGVVGSTSVAVGSNSQPAFSATTATRTLPENTGASVDVVGGTITATDSDSDALTYSLTGTDAGSFEIDSSGQIKTKAGVAHNFNFEATKNSYSVTVNVSDSKNSTGVADTVIDDTIAVTIDLTNVDEAGTVTLPALFMGATEATASVTDPDGTVSGPSWQWARGDTATGSFSDISGATSASYTPVAADVGKYLRATVTYKDPESTTIDKTASATSSSGVGAINSNPTFSSMMATRTLPENSGAGVNVLGGTITATDGNSDTLTYSLTGTDTGSFEIDSNGQLKTKTGVTHSFNFEGATTSYSVTVNVSDSKDDDGNADTVVDDTIAVTINLTDVNDAPTFTSPPATADFAENGTGAIVDFDATDEDGDEIYFFPRFGSNDDSGLFTTTPTGELRFFNPPNFERPRDRGIDNTYVVTVLIEDNGSPRMGASHEITVTVTDMNDAPAITTAATTASVAENSTAVLTLAASDEDASDTQTWSVEAAADGSFFEITQGGALSFTNAPDFEDKQDADTDNVYVVTVKVTDNGSPTTMSDTHTVTVTVTNVNEAPVITTDSGVSSIFDIAENTATTAVIKTFEATDVDAGSVLTWSLEGADAGDFTITKNADGHGELKFRNVPNFEMPADAGTDNVYNFTVRVRDNGTPGRSDTIPVGVTVTGVNEAPDITTAVTTASVAENSTAVLTLAASDVDATTTFTWSVEAADDGSFFEITQGGALSFRSAPDFENKQDANTDNVYEVTVKVTDNGSPTTMSDTHTVTVTVGNVNEAPEITTDSTTYTAFSVDENTATSVVINTYEATDVDANSVLTWSLEGNDAGDFTITKNAEGHGELKFANVPNHEMPVDAGTDNVYDVTVKVRDNHSGQLSDTLNVVVTVDDVNEAPVVSGGATPSFAEIEYDATSPDLTIGTYTYTDQDRNPSDTITWDLSGTDETHFDIGSATGVLSFNMRPDFENPFGTDNVYLIKVKADDGRGEIGTFDVRVTVTNVDETPEITTTTASHTAPSFAEIEYDFTGAPGLEVATYAARDEEGQTISWSLGGDDAGDLTINPSGVLSFRNPPNYEMPAGTPATRGGPLTTPTRSS